MTQEQKIMLGRIYNAMCQINVKGEDAMIMADCLRAVQALAAAEPEANIETKED